MNDLTKYDADTGEVTVMSAAPQALMTQLARAEIDSQVATARAMPRSVSKAMKNILSLVTISQASAEKCNYALPRGGKPITGPSIRLAEIVASQWGNCRVTASVVDVDRFNKVLRAEGTFHDLETNMALKVTVERSIADRQGRLFSPDMIVVTGNAACSIARRNAILAGIPEAIWDEAYQTALRTIKGDVKTLPERRDGAFKAFAAFGVTPDQIVAYFDVGGVEDINLDHLATLIAMHGALKSGDQQVEDYFSAKADPKTAPKGTAGKLADIAASGGAGAKEAQKEADHKAAEANRADDAARQAMQDERDAAKAAGKPKDKAKDKADRQRAAEAEQPQDEAAQKGDGTAQEGEPAGEATDPAADASEGAGGEQREAGGEGDGDGKPPTDDEVQKAFDRGVSAGKRGAKPELCPSEYRAHQRLFDAWNDGHADGVEQAKGGA